MPSKKQRQGEEPSLLELAFCAIRPEDNPFMAQEPAQQKRRPSKRSLKRKAEREKDRVAAKYLDHDIEYGEDDTIGSPESRAAGAGRSLWGAGGGVSTRHGRRYHHPNPMNEDGSSALEHKDNSDEYETHSVTSVSSYSSYDPPARLSREAMGLPYHEALPKTACFCFALVVLTFALVVTATALRYEAHTFVSATAEADGARTFIGDDVGFGTVGSGALVATQYVATGWSRDTGYASTTSQPLELGSCGVAGAESRCLAEPFVLRGQRGDDPFVYVEVTVSDVSAGALDVGLVERRGASGDTTTRRFGYDYGSAQSLVSTTHVLLSSSEETVVSYWGWNDEHKDDARLVYDDQYTTVGARDDDDDVAYRVVLTSSGVRMAEVTRPRRTALDVVQNTGGLWTSLFLVASCLMVITFGAAQCARTLRTWLSRETVNVASR